MVGVNTLGLGVLVAGCAISMSSSKPIPSNYSRGGLPPILEFADGTPVVTMADWTERQQEMWMLLQQYFYGTFPTTAPAAISTATLLNSTTTRSYTITWVNVSYTTPVNETQIVFEVICPDFCTPSVPCPVSMMSKEHRRWNLIAASRGYVAVS